MDFIIHKDDANLQNKIKKSLEENGFCIIKNFFDQTIIKDKIQQFKKTFNPSNDIRISGKYYYKMDNFQRLDMGDYINKDSNFDSKSILTRCRCSRMITQFTWSTGSLFEDEISELIAFRNNLFNLKNNENMQYIINNQIHCDLPKILHYPQGGGFLDVHPDGNHTIPNILISLSKKGSDFKKGGVYYIDKKGNYIDVEEYLDIGDLYTHTTNMLHGVSAIDYDLDINLHDISKGRLSFNLSCEDFK